MFEPTDPETLITLATTSMVMNVKCTPLKSPLYHPNEVPLPVLTAPSADPPTSAVPPHPLLRRPRRNPFVPRFDCGAVRCAYVLRESRELGACRRAHFTVGSWDADPTVDEGFRSRSNRYICQAQVDTSSLYRWKVSAAKVVQPPSAVKIAAH